MPLVVSAAALLGRVAAILHGLVFRSGPVQTLIGALPESAWVHVETICLNCKVQATHIDRSHRISKPCILEDIYMHMESIRAVR